jgi:hypothetical protein
MTIEEAHDLCSLAMLKQRWSTGASQSAPFIVEVGQRFDAGWRTFGRGEGNTLDEAFLAAMTEYARLPSVKAAMQPTHDDT